jgi:hypothetical protein
MTHTKDEALKLALDALKRISTADDDCDFLNVSQAVQLEETIDAIKQALAAPTVQEPVAWIQHHKGGDNLVCDCNQGQVCHVCDPITPPAQPAPVREPVAWLIPGSITTDFELAKANGDSAVALGKISTQQWNPEDHYKDGWRDALESVKRATPPAQPAPVPITPAEVHGMAESHGIDGDARHWYVVGITDSEKHHGITKGQP